MRIKIVKQSEFNPPEWYDGQVGNEFDVHSVDGNTIRVNVPYDLFMSTDQYEFYVPLAFCEVVAE